MLKRSDSTLFFFFLSMSVVYDSLLILYFALLQSHVLPFGLFSTAVHNNDSNNQSWLSQGHCSQWFSITGTKRATCWDTHHIWREEDQSDYTLETVERVKAVKRASPERERLTVCNLERQSSGKLTHTAAGWEHSECWQPKIKEGGRNGAMSNVS